jgi:hypothetical protein
MGDKFNIGFKITSDFQNASSSDAFAVRNKKEFVLTIFVEANADRAFWSALFNHVLKNYHYVNCTFVTADALVTQTPSGVSVSGRGCSRLYSLLSQTIISLHSGSIMCIDADLYCQSSSCMKSPYNLWCHNNSKTYNSNIEDFIFDTFCYSIENIQFDFSVLKEFYALRQYTKEIQDYLLFLEESKDFLYSVESEDYHKWLSSSSQWLKSKSFQIPATQATKISQSPLKVVHLIRGHNLASVVKKVIKELQSQSSNTHMQNIASLATNDISIDKSKQLPEDCLVDIESKLNTILGANRQIISEIPIKKTLDKFDQFMKKHFKI